MKKEMWERFHFNEIENDFKTKGFSCPHCGSIPLAPILNSLIKQRSPKSKVAYETAKLNAEEGFEHEADIDFTNDWGRFSLWFDCENCQKQTFCAGNYKGALAHPFEEPYGEGDLYYYEYTPTFMEPGLTIIHVPEATPETVRKELLSSFSLFFFDKSACAHKLRRAIERLMDEEGVASVDASGKWINLEARISSYLNGDRRVKKEKVKLLAVKWIGNEGTHSEADENSVLEAYEFFEDFLELIYENNAQRIKNRAIEIVRNKGSRSTQP